MLLTHQYVAVYRWPTKAFTKKQKRWCH